MHSTNKTIPFTKKPLTGIAGFFDNKYVCRMKKIIIYSIISILMASCTAMHTGSVSSGPLLSADDRLVDVAYGYVSTSYFLGIGGLSKNALIHNAKQELKLNRPLKKGEYYANYTVDFKKTVSFISYMTNEVFVYADVLSTNKEDTVTPTVVTRNFEKVPKYAISYDYVKTKQDSFYVGEKVIIRTLTTLDKEVYTYNPCEITKFIGKNRANVKSYLSVQNTVIDVNELIFSMDKEKNGFRYGDSVSFESRRPFSNKTISGKIIATSKNYGLVLEGKNIYEMAYKDLGKINRIK
jgi:hypothetical protein